MPRLTKQEQQIVKDFAMGILIDTLIVYYKRSRGDIEHIIRQALRTQRRTT
jgi:Mor family transcriptional regulator